MFQNEVVAVIHAGKRKKPSRLDDQQRSALEASFNVQRFQNKTTLKELALQTGLSGKEISQWFSNKRHLKRKRRGQGKQTTCECIC